jgi:hypothetical protein
MGEARYSKADTFVHKPLKMTHVVTPQFESGARVGLASEAQLRAAAATLSQAELDEITATTVVGVVGLDDLDRFRTLVADISDEFDVEATVRVRVGWFSVRFAHPARAASAPTRNGSKPLFQRILRRGDGNPKNGG